MCVGAFALCNHTDNIHNCNFVRTYDFGNKSIIKLGSVSLYIIEH